MKRVFLLLCALSAFCFSQNQVTPSNDTGLKSYGTYAGALENVNLSNGNLNLRIPLVTLPGRNGHNFTLALTYDSKIWRPHASFGGSGGNDVFYRWLNDSGGWSSDWPFIEQGDWISDENGYLIGHAPTVITLPGGGKTAIASPPNSQSSEMDSEDGSFVHLSWSDYGAQARLKDGTILEFDCTYCDSNVHYTGGSATAITYTDGNRITASGNLISNATGAQVSSTNNAISYKDSNGTTQTITLNYSDLTLFQTTPGQYYTSTPPFQQPVDSSHCTNCTGWIHVSQPAANSVYHLLTSIVLADGTSYQFSYNGYGELIQIRYPTGGYTTYTYDRFEHGENFWQYAGQDIAADFREVTSKRVCRKTTGDCSPAEEDVTTYTPSIASPALNNDQVDVLNPAIQLTRYQFTNTTLDDNWSQYHTPRERMRYIYADNGATLLRSVETQYSSFDPDPSYQYINEYLPTSIITTLYDVSPPLVTRTNFTYDTYSATVLWPPAQDYILQGAQPRTRYIDNAIQQTESDYGQNAAGPTIRITNTTWWKDKWSSHIWDRPFTEEVQDGTATRLSLTQYEYDNFTEGLTSSGRGLDPGPGGGTRTAVSRWRNSDGAMLTTRYQYDDAFNVRKITDPAGHSTTFSYTDNWGNAACLPPSGQAAAFPTTIQNQLGHQTVTTYNSCTGTVASQRDANLQTTSTTYDAMHRPLTVTYPDGGFTQYTYSSPTLTLIKKKPASGVTDQNLWPATQIFYDGLGRTSQTASKNGESGSGWDVKTTCYDTRGYTNFTSYPAQVSSVPVASPCILAGDTLQVDALGRVTQLTHSDGSTILTDYAGRATRVKDEGRDNSGSRVVRVSQVDALGRLTSVCGKSSSNLPVGSNNVPGACGQDLQENGFLTTYQYDIHDPAGSAWQVIQPGLANRYFVSDSLGQLVKATNPESGTTQYTYNDDGTLHTRARPKPNQQDPSLLTTTTYLYDVLHRLTETHYDDTTPWIYHLYDQASVPSGQTLSNPVGRLTTLNAVAGQSVNLYSYDAMGRVSSNWQCTPSNCGSSFKQLAYSYDLLGNATSASNGFGVNIGYNYNTASRLISVTSNAAQGPTTLLSNVSYGPFGPVSATFGNGVNESRGYTSRGLLNSISDTVTINNPAIPGSGSVTISGSERTIGGPPATVATGSVTLSGSIQSTQVLNQAAAGGTGTVNITGNEQNTQAMSYAGTPGQATATISGQGRRGYDDNCTCYVYESGSIYLSVNGYTQSTSYNYLTPASSIAATLANGFYHTGTSSGGNIWMTARTNGANTNYAVSMWFESDRPDLFGPDGAYGPSFTFSWTNFSGGTDPTYYTLYDTGSVTATVNGFSKSTSYGQGSTTSTVAAGLASAFNGDGASPVTASSSGASLTLTSKATGANTNYSLSASSATGQGSYFSSPSFAGNPASATLLGGRDASYSTLYDSGNVSITVNGVTKSTSYSQSSTLSGLASALATAFNNDTSAPVTASASSATVSLTSRSTGAAANYPLSASSSTSQGTYFSHPSFSGAASGSTLTGGQDPGANINDTGTVSITVNGFTKSASYGQSSTPSSVASALGTAFNGDVNSPVTATVSGGQVTLTAKTPGVATNYTLSASSATNNASFTGTSFPASPSGANLTGGADGYSQPTTPYSVALTFTPNGNVWTANDNVNGNWSYGYDDFNRLSAASKTGASYTYAYDRYGNRWQQNGPTTMLLTFSSGNNRMDGYTYDAAGNLMNDNAGHSFSYDAENRIIQVGTNVYYTYDGDGRRIRKTVNGSSVDFYYDLGGHDVAEMNSSGGWNRGEIFAGERHIATYANSTTYFTHSDWLGTERSRTALSGVVCRTTQSLPFGDGTSNPVNNCNPSPNLFTGKERDAETGLDYFKARYFGSNVARFLSPDQFNPLYLNKEKFQVWISNPQHWNKYAYVLNNPLSYTDASGMTETIYYWLSDKLTDEQKKYFQEHKKEIFDAIAKKLAEAGIKDVVFKDGNSLQHSQISSMIEKPPSGVAFLNIANTSYGGHNAGSGEYGGHVGIRVAVFVGRLQDGHPDASKMAFRIAEAASHELGHRMGFYSSDMYPVNDVRNFFSNNLMNEGRWMPNPSNPGKWDMSNPQNRQAVEEVNKQSEYGACGINDYRPPK
jgi:RHS repeat-associated protein